MSQEQTPPEPLHPEQLTWAILLAQWVDLAKSASTLGPDSQSQAIRNLVPDIIMLQAVWYALTDLSKLEMTEQKLGCLRALWLIERHEAVIRNTWPDDELPALLQELIADAKTAYEAACKHIDDHNDAADTDCPEPEDLTPND